MKKDAKKFQLIPKVKGRQACIEKEASVIMKIKEAESDSASHKL